MPLTGMLLHWSQNGWSHFGRPPPKCLALKPLCSHQHMPSSVVSKRTFVTHSLNFLTAHLEHWRRHWWKHIENLATIISSLMSHHIIFGLRVRVSSLLVANIFLVCPLSVLDPRISYQGLLADCGDDLSLKSHLKLVKERLKARYREQYMPKAPTTAPQQSSSSPQKVNFTAWYKQWSRTDIDELEEFWKLPQEDFENCDPVQWWAGRQAQFSGLSWFARDIFTIPGQFAVIVFGYILNPHFKGSAVAVEWIFSGGRDTISLRHASLQPETIRTLMLVKQRLCLAQAAIQEIIWS
jgi:hypothetical protein